MSTTVRSAFILACVVFGLMRLGIGCVNLTPADRSAITDTAATLERCQEVGRACKLDGGADCYGQYEACMSDAGMYQ